MIGLTPTEVLRSRALHGANKLVYKKQWRFWVSLKSIVKEPMTLLLLAASSIYFASGEFTDGFFLAGAIVLIASISLYQDARSRRAMENLKAFSQPFAKVIREGVTIELPSEELVVGDCMVVEEGGLIPADATIVEAHDFTVNESILTGESMPVSKSTTGEPIYFGTTVTRGNAVAEITQIGNLTELGKIGKRLEDIKEEKTPLEKQISRFVQRMAIIGLMAFVVVWLINFFQTKDIAASFLQSLTLAMSILPEEIPVAFSTFMALGSYRLMKMGIIIKQMKTVETLGSATVICVDKTGTITQNKMELHDIWALPNARQEDRSQNPSSSDAERENGGKELSPTADKLTDTTNKLNDTADKLTDTKNKFIPLGNELLQTAGGIDQAVAYSPAELAARKELLRVAMLASEPVPFDPMEKSIHAAYEKQVDVDERPFVRMVQEYPLGGKPPMMTHVFQHQNGELIIAAKGAPEAFLSLLDQDQMRYRASILEKLDQYTKEGYRVLGVAIGRKPQEELPEEQQKIPFHFLGLVAFYDPPKNKIHEVIQSFYDVGLSVKIITGDNAGTTLAIAREIGFQEPEKQITGAELMKLSEKELEDIVVHTHLYTRMFPEAKWKIIKALQAKGEVVAMTGDGVNDGPALKAAHIGIAMGKKGTDIAKNAASMILIEDDLSKMTEAIAMGRKIYANLKKAIQYIISIHIPIILTVLIPLSMGWMYPNIFTPIHVIFFELIMGPTCSIIYENEPMERNLMQQKPRAFSNSFFHWKELSISIVQGLMITAGILLVYQYAIQTGQTEAATRTIVFLTLLASNMTLTLTNRSFYYSVWTTLQYKNRLVPLVLVLTLGLTALILSIPAISRLFSLEWSSWKHTMGAVVVGMLSVLWIEMVKLYRRNIKP